MSRGQVPAARARRSRRERVAVLAKTDFRWSWTVCSDRPMVRGDVAGVASGAEVADELGLPPGQGAGPAEQRQSFGGPGGRSPGVATKVAA
jgi:hypothetical protein